MTKIFLTTTLHLLKIWWEKGATLPTTSSRYVGAIWFLFHVLQLLLIRLAQQNSCCISKSMMKHMQTPDCKMVFPWLSYDYQKCMFVDVNWIYRSSLLCSLFECRVVVNIQSSPNHIPMKYRGLIK